MTYAFQRPPSAWLDDRSHAEQLLGAYLTPSLFTGALWDPSIQRRLGPDSCNVIEIEDLYAPALLSATIEKRSAMQIVEQRSTITGHLCSIPPDLTLWDADKAKVLESLAHAEDLAKLLDDIHHIGDTKASKLLAAKRPMLLPIWDKQVAYALGASRKMTWIQYWTAWRDDLTPEVVRKSESIAATSGQADLSPLRVLDIVIWMDAWGWRDLPSAGMDNLRQACEQRNEAARR